MSTTTPATTARATTAPREGHGRVAPLLKWPGGKARELPLILDLAPASFERYFEPFLGGGAMLFALPPSVPAYVNDASADLMALYASVARQDPSFYAVLEAIDGWWERLRALVEASGDALVDAFVSLRHERRPERRQHDGIPALLAARRHELRATVPPLLAGLSDGFVSDVETAVPRKVARMRQVEVERRTELSEPDAWANIEGAIKASCYTTLRRAYNASRRAGGASSERAALFLFLREYAYAAMFRFNAAGEFNVPYGGVSYNRKSLARKIEHLRSEPVSDRLRGTVLASTDFAEFLTAHEPGPDDFAFLDPPYDSDFRDYDHQGFGPRDHERLASALEALACRFLLVIKATPLTRRLFARPGWQVLAADKTYAWTIKDRNDRRAVHLLVTNYEHDGGQAAITPAVGQPGTGRRRG